jgi:hypothetical protein
MLEHLKEGGSGKSITTLSEDAVALSRFWRREFGSVN